MINVRFFSCILLFLVCGAVRADTIAVLDFNEYLSREDVIPQSFLLVDLTYTSDVYFSEQEFRYLVDLPVGTLVSNNQMRTVVSRLFQKKVFEQIRITLTDNALGKRLHFDLTGSWTFQKLKVSGVLVGRDWYKQYYCMEPGDAFDRDTHAHSMKKIQDACRRDGFFNTKTSSNFLYDTITKSVTVQTAIDRGSKFFIGDVLLTLQAEQDMPLGEIKSIEQQVYKRFFRTMRNVRYTKNFIEQRARAIKRYLAQKGFLQPTIVLTETVCRKDCYVHLDWQIDLKKKRTFIFFGNRFLSHAQLLDLILQFGRSAWIVPASILAQELQSAYNAKGFWDVVVDARDEEDRSFFVIKEGKRAVIDQIKIQNAYSIAPRKIIKRCTVSLKRASFFDRDLMNTAFDDLIDLYLKEGFLDIKIVAHEFVLMPSNHYKLVISIDEGARTVIDRVSIPGYPELQMQGPFCVIHQSKQAVSYDFALIQNQKKWLTDLFHKQGYLFVAIKSELKTDDEQTVVVWHIDPGRKVLFGKTIIQGSTTFPFENVMRELQYQQDQLWDQEKIRRSFLRLKDLQLFDAVSCTPIALPGTSEQCVFIKLHQDDPFEVRLRAGFELQHIRQYQTFTGLAYKVGGTFMVKNPFCCGDQLRFDVDVARSHYEMVFKYRYPWPFKLPINSSFQLYNIKYEQPGFVGSKNDIYTLFRTGCLMGVQRKVSYFDIGGNVGFEWFKTKLNRTRGMFCLMSLKGMFPTKALFADSYFIKLLVECSWFLPVRSVVAAFRIRFGHIFHRLFEDIMPNERFYLGGAHSIRSYITDLSPPLGCFVDDDCKRYVVPRGGKTMLNVNIELRVPLFQNAGIVLFQDIGALSSDRFADYNIEDIVAGTGFGIRYLTPIGPLRFDIAWKWKKQSPDEHGYNWFLTFGQAF